MDRCTKGSIGRSGSCTTARRGLGVCIANPFDTNCDIDVYFKDYAVQARAARVEFCNIPANNNDPYCLGAGTMVTTVQICNFDPFSRYCFSGTTYKTARENKLVSCSRSNSFDKGDCAGVRNRVTTAGWLNSFPSSPDSSPSTSRPKNQFLQTNVSGLNVGTTTTADGSGSPTVFYLNMSALGGDVKDGLGFFTGYTNGTRYNYVGILEQANLGAPLTQTSGTANWSGQIESFTDSFNARDFVLTVNFGGDRGAGNIDAFVKVNNDIGSDLYYELEGEFNTDGIIDGTTKMGLYAYGNRKYLIVDSWTDGVLSGLIGTEGAVAGFISNDGASVGYAGGFIASPAASGNQNVTYSGWLRGFDNPLDSHLDTRNEFVRDRSITDSNLSTATFEGVALGRDAADGISFGRSLRSGTYRYWAAIVTGADLGVPLTRTHRTATWNGSFQERRQAGTYFAKDFSLSINFSAKTLKAFVLSENSDFYKISGRYNNQGVITGDVVRGAFNNNDENSPKAGTTGNSGKLRGIIGQQGALGVFISNEATSVQYSGGFVASPTASPSRNVNYSDWLRGFNNPLDNVAAGPNKFLRGQGARKINLSTARFNGRALGGDVADGISFGADLISGVYRHWAAIGTGADLGTPLPQGMIGKATWNGSFRERRQARVYSAKDFSLSIDFYARTVKALVFSTNSDFYNISGTYNNQGVITGSVDRGIFNNNDENSPKAGTTRSAGKLSGLIGQQGALGVFISNEATSVQYSGGFVASPTASPSRNVNYSDWLHGFDNPLDNHLGTQNKFRTAQPSEDLNLSTAAFDGVALGGDAADGISFGGPGSGSSSYPYWAAIGTGADLGAPLPEGMIGKATWNGSFRERRQAGTYSAKDFSLAVDFSAKTVKALVLSTNSDFYKISGTYNDQGFITGSVDRGAFNDNDRNSPKAGTISSGKLSGLIGQQGALGVFISNEAASVQYSGGFVASPTAIGKPNVTYFDWLHGFDNPLDNHLDTRNEFVRDRSSTVLNLSTATFEGVALGRDAADGISFSGPYSGNPSYPYWAAIGTGADLGVPLTRTHRTATWNGSFQERRQAGTYFAKDFSLSIDFYARTVKAFVFSANSDFYKISGTYNNQGFITGRVDRGTFNNNDENSPRTISSGKLRGLIGTEGALGVFISNARTGGYSGGFVASPTASPSRNVTYSDWLRGFNNPLDNVAAGPNKFLRDQGARKINLSTARFNGRALGGDVADGVDFGGPGGSPTSYPYWAAIGTGANLGLPLTHRHGTATWNGKLVAYNRGRFHNRDISLQIDFYHRTISANNNTPSYRPPDGTVYKITGRYDSQGVISGTISKDTTTSDDNHRGDRVGVRTNSLPGRVSGIIGQQGAVGAFIGNNNNNYSGYSGGFVARP